MDTETRTRAADIFGALGNPTRLKIVGLLTEGERTVNEIAGELEIGQSSASQHLAILTRAGLLAVEPRGSARVYRVRGPRLGQILTLIEEFCQIHGLRGEVATETVADIGAID